MVYLLCFRDKEGKPSRIAGHAGHYLGYADDVDKRVSLHRKGQGARLTQVAVELGMTIEIVRTWKGDRNLERKLKNRKNAPKLCPVCGHKH